MPSVSALPPPLAGGEESVADALGDGVAVCDWDGALVALALGEAPVLALGVPVVVPLGEYSDLAVAAHEPTTDG